MENLVEDLKRQKQAALKLLARDTSFRAKAVKQGIEDIVPETATRRERVRLEQLCRKVASFYEVDLRDPAILRS